MEKIYKLNMAKYDLSLCLAGIRPQFWENVFKSAADSCQRHSFELIIVSPFDLPEPLRRVQNIRHLKDYGPPTRASQLAVNLSEGRLISFPCDDGIFLSEGNDHAIELFDRINKRKDGIVMRYREAAGMKGETFPEEYWYARRHLNTKELHLDEHWKIACQPMISKDYFREIGGVDCLSFECMAYATHDLCYRIQRDGGVFHLSPKDVMNADNYGETGVDHAPVFFGQKENDEKNFFSMYRSKEVKKRVKVDFHNWENSSSVWARRWPNGIP